MLANSPASDLPRTRRPAERRTVPSADISGDASELDLVASRLSTPSRALLRLLYDWPFIQVFQLQRMTGVSEGHLGRLKGQLSRARLVHHLRVGRTPKRRRDNETRLSLSETGLLYLTQVDRSSNFIARQQWLVKPCDEGDEEYRIPHFQVTGTKGRTLLREIRHTDGVYAFISLLMSSCKTSMVWDLVQALPAHRWERHYKYGTRRNRLYRHIRRSIRPDATFILRHPDKPFSSFVLEFERRAKSPSTIGPKIERYRPYYASKETSNDFPDGRHPYCSFSKDGNTPAILPGTRRLPEAARCRYSCPALRIWRGREASSGTAGCIPGDSMQETKF